MVNETEDGEPCLKWTDVEKASEYIGVDGVNQTKTDYCKARTCEYVEVSKLVENQMLKIFKNC